MRLGLARVHGSSMVPTLRQGDRLLLLHGARPRPGSVVVVRFPDGTTAVKRATVRMADGWWVERDNPHTGVDSALVGTIPEDRVVGVVPLRLWPRPRLLSGRPARPRPPASG